MTPLKVDLGQFVGFANNSPSLNEVMFREYMSLKVDGKPIKS